MAFSHQPLRRAGLGGVLTYVAGYLLTVGATAGRIEAVLAVEVSGEYADAHALGAVLGPEPSLWTVAGWLFANAHFVPTSVPTADATRGMVATTVRNLLDAVGGPLLLLYLVPVLLLPVAGYLVVRTSTTHGVRGELKTGASVGLGYGACFVGGAFLFVVEAASVPVLAGPHGVASIFVAIIYAPLLGALGGHVARYRTEREPSEPRRRVE